MTDRRVTVSKLTGLTLVLFAAQACVLKTEGTEPSTSKEVAKTPASSVDAGSGSNRGTSGDGGAGADGYRSLAVGQSVEVLLNTSTPPIVVPNASATRPQHGGIFRIDLRSDKTTTIAACPPKGTDIYPYIVMHPVGAPNDQEHGDKAPGGYEAYGQYVELKPQQSGTYVVYVYNFAEALKDTGGRVVVSAANDVQDFRCPGDG